MESASILVIPYIVFSVFIGYLGRNKRIGGVNAYGILVVISLTLTPLIGLIFLLTARTHDPFEEEAKKKAKQYKCEKCGWKFDYKFENCPHCNAKAE